MDRVPTHDAHDYATGEKYNGSGSDSRSSDDGNKYGENGKYHEPSEGQPIEPIRTISRIPGNPNYYEKNGLRTYGDGQDHETEPPLTWSRALAMVGMAFLWCGSQIPVYLYGGILPSVYAEIGGVDIYVWAVIGNLLAIAAVTPFVGGLSDLFGRRTTACAGIFFIMIGMIICAAAQTMNQFIAGEVIAGVGGGICEMTALAGTGELAPTSKRGIYVGLVICTIGPFTPAIMWSELITNVAPNGSWRWIGLFIALWSLIGLLLVFFFYHPPPRPNRTGLSRRELVKRLDLIGAILSAAGISLFLLAIIWGGYSYPWSDAHVLGPLIVGALLFIGFIVYEWKFARYPMFPGRLRQEPRVLYAILFITFTSGANFFAVLIWWTIESQSLYDPDPIQIGIRGLPIGFGIIGGAVVVSIALALIKGNIRLLIFVGCAIMTAGTAAMIIADPYNINVVYAPITLACFGVGSVIIPNQIIITIICPDDLIATATALAISVRMVGGAVGFAIFYNLFLNKFTEQAFQTIVPAVTEAGVYNYNDVVQIALDIGHSYFQYSVYKYPEINTQAKYDAIVFAGRQCFAIAFKEIWYAAVAFGAISTIASLFLGDISKYMDDHVAVVMH